jgi:exodeoxyribonuclease VII large subunit
MYSSLLHRVQLQSAQVKGMQRRLEALSPLAVLARGYAVVTRNEDGSVVSRVGQTRDGQKINIRVSDGQLDAEIVNRNA